MEKKRFSLLGADVSGSYSAVLHGIISEYGDFKYDYDLLSVTADELPSVLRDERYDGFNVTMPYKGVVTEYLDEISEEAAAVGAVNTIVRDNGRLIGYNTDIYGFMEMAGADRIAGRRCVVLGTGGASRAVCEALRRLGAAEIVRASRDPSKVSPYTSGSPAAPSDPAVTTCSYRDLSSCFDAEVVVNTTPAGMYPDITGTPLHGTDGCPRIEDFERLETLLDIIYTPARTKLMCDAERFGAETVSGLRMLVYQGIAASRLWQGKSRYDESVHELAKAAMNEIYHQRLNLVVIGMPGSGKSSISRRIAKIWKKNHVDIDRVTEEMLGTSIPAAIEERGEQYFRAAEEEAVRKTVLKSGAVIATGGGSVLSEKNRQYLRSNSVIVYLRRPNRLLATKGRPISGSKGVDRIYSERAAIYEELADITIDNVKRFGTTTDKNGRRHSYNEDMNAFARMVIRRYDKYIEKLSEK